MSKRPIELKPKPPSSPAKPQGNKGMRHISAVVKPLTDNAVTRFVTRTGAFIDTLMEDMETIKQAKKPVKVVYTPLGPNQRKWVNALRTTELPNAQYDNIAIVRKGGLILGISPLALLRQVVKAAKDPLATASSVAFSDIAINGSDHYPSIFTLSKSDLTLAEIGEQLELFAHIYFETTA